MKEKTYQSSNKLDAIIGVNYGKISAISPQKKSSDRYSLFVNDIFVIGISEYCLLKLNLTTGDHFDQELLDNLCYWETYYHAKKYVFVLLSRRDHSILELKQKGIKKGIPLSTIEVIIPEMIDKGYINELAFAKHFAYDKFKFNHWGIHKISIELRKKGISNSIIESALQTIPFNEKHEKLNHLFRKHYHKFKRIEAVKRRKKIFAFFYRKGYDSDTIKLSLSEWLIKLEA